MDIDFEVLTRFSILVACCLLGVAVVGSAIYLFHYASEQTKPTDKNRQVHFTLAWTLIVSLTLFGAFSVFYVVKYKKSHSNYSSAVKSLRETAKKPLF